MWSWPRLGIARSAFLPWEPAPDDDAAASTATGYLMVQARPGLTGAGGHGWTRHRWCVGHACWHPACPSWPGSASRDADDVPCPSAQVSMAWSSAAPASGRSGRTGWRPEHAPASLVATTRTAATTGTGHERATSGGPRRGRRKHLGQGLPRVAGATTARPVEVVGRPYPTHRPRPGQAEQRAQDWLDGLACVLGGARRDGSGRSRSGRWASAPRSTRTCWWMTAHPGRRPPSPGRTCAAARRPRSWMRRRRGAARRSGGAVRRSTLRSRCHACCGSRATTRTRSRAARWVMSPHDWWWHRSWARSQRTPSAPSGSWAGTAATSKVWPRWWTVPHASCHRYARSMRSAGTTRAGDPAGLPAGVPVAVGTMDAFGNVYGSGLVRPGRAMEVAGTSEIRGGRVRSGGAHARCHLVRARARHPRPRRAHAGRRRCAPVGGSHLRLHAGGRPRGGRVALGDPQAIVFLPYLAGERAPLWDPDGARRVPGHVHRDGAGHLALAVLEGVAFAARHLLEACEHAAGIPVDLVAALRRRQPEARPGTPSRPPPTDDPSSSWRRSTRRSSAPR